jgi:hypothetical protein
MYCNFVGVHQTLRVTLAMAAGVSKKLWEVSDIVEMLEQWELANFKPEYGFEKEADALQWIKKKSQAWLIEQNRADRVE